MESVFYGVNIAVIVLIYLAIKDIWNKSIVDKLSALWFLLIFLLSVLKISPVILILASILSGIVLQKIKDIKNAKC